MADPREEQRAWLRAVLEKTGQTPGALARAARISAPTLTEFLNNPNKKHALSARTIAAIEQASGIKFGPEPRPVGLREPEAAPYKAQQRADLNFVGEAIKNRNGVDPWNLKSRALETAGYLPGDIMIVDLNATPEPGDVVCAQLYDWARSKAETVFRIWEPPYLVASTYDPAFRKVFIVDNSNTVMKGVVVASIRQRLARAA